MWQLFAERHANDEGFRLLSVAVDAEPDRVRPFVEGLSFPTAIDATGLLGRLFDFDVVPNGFFLDEAGVLRFRHVGGFDIRRPEIEQQVEALIGADFAGGERPEHVRQEGLDIEVLRSELTERPDDAGLRFALGDAFLREGRPAEAEEQLRLAASLDPADWSAPFALGTALQAQGRRDDALAAWRAALGNDPDNFTVRKQIWRVEHPERFYPDIDFEWQKEQMAREGYTPPA